MKTVQVTLSRRRALVGVGCLLMLGGGAVLNKGAQAKVAKAEFQYQDRPHEGKSCASCRFFSADHGAPSGTCALVEGEVRQDGWCVAYAAQK